MDDERQCGEVQVPVAWEEGVHAGVDTAKLAAWEEELVRRERNVLAQQRFLDAADQEVRNAEQALNDREQQLEAWAARLGSQQSAQARQQRQLDADQRTLQTEQAALATRREDLDSAWRRCIAVRAEDMQSRAQGQREEEQWQLGQRQLQHERHQLEQALLAAGSTERLHTATWHVIVDYAERLEAWAAQLQRRVDHLAHLGISLLVLFRRADSTAFEDINARHAHDGAALHAELASLHLASTLSPETSSAPSPSPILRARTWSASLSHAPPQDTPYGPRLHSPDIRQTFVLRSIPSPTPS